MQKRCSSHVFLMGVAARDTEIARYSFFAANLDTGQNQPSKNRKFVFLRK
jgi:hypothetical protein